MTATARRLRVVGVAKHALARAPLHYTEGSSRWDAVEHPDSWHYADCSSFATSTYKGAGEPDPNRNHYRAGYTGTLCRHGVAVRAPKPADLGFFGHGPPWSHTAVWDGTEWISHGSEGGPRKEPLHYRGDLGQIRRYIFDTKAHYAWALFASFGRVWTGKTGAKLPGWAKTAAGLIKGGRVKRVRVK